MAAAREKRNSVSLLMSLTYLSLGVKKKCGMVSGHDGRFHPAVVFLGCIVAISAAHAADRGCWL